MLKKGLLFGLVLSLATVVACGGDSKTPVSPTTTATSEVDAAADGSTLKVSAPALWVPASGTTVDSLTPNLATFLSSGRFVSASSLLYRFVVETQAGQEVYRSDLVAQLSGTNYAAQRVPTGALQHSTTYRWRTRAESGSAVGPWSTYATFKTPDPITPVDKLPSYNRANELWDNLADGRSIGTVVGGTFIQGKGVLLPTFESRVTYQLLNTLSSGVTQFLIEGLDLDTNGGKTKVWTMQQGYSDITDNPYRFNLEKRGDDHPDAGKFRMRIITGNPEEGGFFDSPRLLPTSLSRSKTYFIKNSWGGGVVSLEVREGGPNGPAVVTHSFSYQHTYRPNPHVVHIGVPVPRGGPGDATVPGIIVRYFHVSDGTKPWPGLNVTASMPEFGDLFKLPGMGN
jgi:hypothetical protein